MSIDKKSFSLNIMSLRNIRENNLLLINNSNINNSLKINNIKNNFSFNNTFKKMINVKGETSNLNYNLKEQIREEKSLVFNSKLCNKHIENCLFKLQILKNNKKQIFKFKWVDYFIPYCFLKKYERYQFLINYYKILNYYLSLEVIIQIIENFYLFNREYIKTNKFNIKKKFK